MPRFLLAAFAAATLLSSSLRADDRDTKDKDSPKHISVTITKIDAKKGEITVKYTDDKGKKHEKTFELTSDVKLFDETGRVVAIDVFESGNEALILAAEGKLTELRQRASAHRGHRLSDAVKTLLEMTEGDEAYIEEVQRIYDIVRKLDPDKTGKIDPKLLKVERERILEERVKNVFERLDTDKDGKISKEEAKGMLKEHFDRIDKNKDGFIDHDELLQAAREKHAQKPTQPEKK
jgi:Ca2+-binding EF-hand superfamily protein